MTCCTTTFDTPLVVTLFTGPPGTGGSGGGGGNWYLSQFAGNGIVQSFHPINGFSTTDAARYQVVIDGSIQEPNYSYDILEDNGGTLLFPVPIYAGARISVVTQNT